MSVRLVVSPVIEDHQEAPKGDALDKSARKPGQLPLDHTLCFAVLSHLKGIMQDQQDWIVASPLSRDKCIQACIGSRVKNTVHSWVHQQLQRLEVTLMVCPTTMASFSISFTSKIASS